MSLAPCLARVLAVLKEKFEGQLMELEELMARSTLLGACMVCPTLISELEQLRAQFEVLSAPTDTCENCLTLRMQLGIGMPPLGSWRKLLRFPP